MPTSWMEAIPEIIEEVWRQNPESILDIGVGFGKYGMLLREKLEIPFKRYSKEEWKVKIDGIEAFHEYKNPIHEFIYNQLYYDTVEDRIDKLPEYDVVLFVDVIEHFEKEKGKEIVKKILGHTKKALIISTPLYPAVQGAYLGNTFEEHKSRWMQIDFAEFDFDYKMIPIEKNGAQIYVIYRKEEKKKEFTIDIIMAAKTPSWREMTIAYFLPHKNLTGGLKMLLEQMKHLQKKGHKIHAYRKGALGESALPDWFDLEVEKEIIVPGGETFIRCLAGDEVVGVAGWIEQTPELSGAPFPILYWEQGSEYLFGELPDPSYRYHLKHCYQQPVALASVSPFVADIIAARYNRVTEVIPNGVDTTFYYPGEKANENAILLVGNPHLMFKGFDVALKVLIRLYQSGQTFKVKWACQAEPSIAKLKFPFPFEFLPMPSQAELAKLYREADVFLSTSWYEGFGMPPLEAMSSGTAVVATYCGGIQAYAENGKNSLLTTPGDVEGLAQRVSFLLHDHKTRYELAKTGRETALRFSARNMNEKLEDYLLRML